MNASQYPQLLRACARVIQTQNEVLCAQRRGLNLSNVPEFEGVPLVQFLECAALELKNGLEVAKDVAVAVQAMKAESAEVIDQAQTWLSQILPGGSAMKNSPLPPWLQLTPLEVLIFIYILVSLTLTTVGLIKVLQ